MGIWDDRYNTQAEQAVELGTEGTVRTLREKEKKKVRREKVREEKVRKEERYTSKKKMVPEHHWSKGKRMGSGVGSGVQSGTGEHYLRVLEGDAEPSGANERQT